MHPQHQMNNKSSITQQQQVNVNQNVTSGGPPTTLVPQTTAANVHGGHHTMPISMTS